MGVNSLPKTVTPMMVQMKSTVGCMCVHLQLHQHEFSLTAAVYMLYQFADRHYETVSARRIRVFVGTCVGVKYRSACL